MNNIKETPEYKLSKIAVIKKLYEDKNEANKVIQNLSENLANSKNKIEELLKPKNCIPSGALPVELEPSVENNNDNEILELKSEIEGHFKINNELQQENEELKNNWSNSCNKYCKEIEELKKENEVLKQKLCHIEATMKAFSVLLNYEVS